MTTKKYRTTKQGIKGILERNTTKGPRPADKSGWDLYGDAVVGWTLEKFVADEEEADRR